MAQEYDIIVIGSGPGGYVAALRASQLGLKTAIVEREHLGGICLNWGCIPTKSLLVSSELLHAATHAADYGLHVEGRVTADLRAIVARSRKVSARLNSGVEFLMRKNRIDVIWGEARLDKAPTSAQPGTIIVAPAPQAMRPQHPVPAHIGTGTYTARHIILATGARPRLLPGVEADGKLIWTYFNALMPEKLPRSLAVIGSGAIGIELASFYRTLGVRTTVIEMMPRILPAEDEEISALARDELIRQGLEIHTCAKVSQVDKTADAVTVHFEDDKGKKHKLHAERLLSAVGVIANTANLGLEGLGVTLLRGCVATDGYGRTNIPGIYAIGDVAGPPMLAHKAEHEGVICVEKIAGMPHVAPLDRSRIPACTYCTPQIASVGLTEAAARERGLKIRVGRFPFAANGKAIVLGRDRGLVKTIFDAEHGELLGAHLIGPDATELIYGFVSAMNSETTEADLIHSVFPHPTLSEAVKESVLNAYGRTLNA